MPNYIQKIIILLLIHFSINTQAQSTVSPQHVCYGSLQNYSVDTADGPNGTPGSTYTWFVTESTFTGTYTNNGTNSIIIDWNNTPAGNYTLRLNEINSGCYGPFVSLQIILHAQPLISFASNDAIICQTSSRKITAVVDPLDDGTNYTYLWSVPSGASDPGNVSTFEASVAGTYSVTATNTTFNCSSVSNEIILTVNPLPSTTVTTSEPTTFCDGGNAELTATTDTGTSFVWKKDGGAISGATATTYSATESGAYSVTITNPEGCVKTSDPITISVNPLPTASITSSNPTTFCNGGNAMLKANTDTGTSYVWKKDGVIISGATAATYSATESGTYTVTITNNNGCIRTSNPMNITVNQLPTAAITTADPAQFCAGENAALTVNTDTGTSYEWKKDSAIISGATTATYSATESGSYTVTITNSNGCAKTSDSLSITVNPIPITSAISHN
jgi:hypothetical protein